MRENRYDSPTNSAEEAKNLLKRLLFSSRRRLNVLFSLVICSVPMAPALVVLYLTNQWLGIATSLACLLSLLAGVGLRRKPSPLAAALTVPYWFMVLAMQVFFAPIGWIMNPAFFSFACVLALLVLASRFERRLASIVPIVATASLAVFTAIDLIPASHTLSILAATLGLAAAGVMAWMSSRGLFSKLSHLAVALFVLNIMVFPRGFMNYKMTFPGDLEKVLAQPSVKTIYTYRDPETRKSIPPQVMFMARVPGSDKYILGPHDPFKDLHLFTPGEPPGDIRLDFGGRGGDNHVFDPEDPSVFYLLGRDSLHRISTQPLRILDTVDLGYSKMPLSYLRYDDKTDTFVAVRTLARQVSIIDRRTLQVQRVLNFPRRAVVNNAWFDAVHHELFVSGSTLTGWLLMVYDTDTWEVTKSTHGGHGPSLFGFSMDRMGRRGYLQSYLTGMVDVVDLDTLKNLDSFRLDIGIYSMNFDTERRMLLAASHFVGHILAYDADRQVVAGSLFLGKRVRWIDVDDQNGKWYVTSSVGGFEIDPEEFMKPLN